MTRQHTVVLARAVSYASGRIAVIRCISPRPYLTHKYTRTHTYTHARNPSKPSFLKFDRIRNGARYLPTRISRTASLFARIYRPWIIGSLRRMIGYTKFDSPHRLFFIPRSIPGYVMKRSAYETFGIASYSLTTIHWHLTYILHNDRPRYFRVNIK